MSYYTMSEQLKKQRIDEHLSIWDEYFTARKQTYKSISLLDKKIPFCDYKMYSAGQVYWCEFKSEKYLDMCCEMAGSFTPNKYFSDIPTGHRITQDDTRNYSKCVDLHHQLVISSYRKELKAKLGLVLANNLSSFHYISHILKEKFYILEAIPAMKYIADNYQRLSCPFVLTESGGGSRRWFSLSIIWNPDDFPKNVILYSGSTDYSSGSSEEEYWENMRI